MYKLLPQTHQAITRTPRGVQLCHVRTPTVGAGELLLAPLVAGLCGTDIQILRGERDDPAQVLGHEGVAEIAKVGQDCPDYLVRGSKIIVNPTHPHDSAEFLLGHTNDGLLQEYVRIPASAVSTNLIVPFVEKLPLSMTPLIEPLAAVLYAFELLRPHQSQGSIIIYGDGIIGHLALLFIRIHFGRSLPIIFVHHRQEGLDWSHQQQMQGDLDLLFTELPIADMKLATLPAPSFALLATPRTASLACLSHAIASVAPHGCIDLFGGLPGNTFLPELPNLNLTKLRAANCGGFPKQGVHARVITAEGKPLVLFGHRGVSNDHLLQAMVELSIYGIAYSKLVSHFLDLKDTANFMHQLSQQKSRQINGQRVMKLGVRINNNISYHSV
jgi:threonine dehydrogenase-like Zn-dependent dehydrogenase